MKKIANFLTPALSVAAIVFSVAAFSTTCAATHANSNAAPETAAVASMPSAQPIDLTYAADKALPSVVHIKYVQNSKIQTVEVQRDPFEIDPVNRTFTIDLRITTGFSQENPQVVGGPTTFHQIRKS